MRFDDPKHLKNWRDGVWPAIHNPLFELIVTEAEGRVALDLCCCHGLLGTRLMRSGFRCIGLDGNPHYIQQAKAAGLPMFIVELNLKPPFSKLLDLLLASDVSILVARRCLPELFGECLPYADTFFEHARNVGIKEIFLQGRRNADRSDHPLRSVEDEINLIQRSGAFRLMRQAGDCCYLKATR